ncbi:MAG: hypothetical protein ABIH39_02260, partial [Candidatus Margulisiibacteriota bacterium]
VKKTIVYSFTLQFPIPFTANPQSMLFSFVDPTNFIAYETTLKNIKTEGEQPLISKAAIDKDFCRYEFSFCRREEQIARGK